MATPITFLALFIIGILIVVLAVLGLILAIIRSTRVAGMTLLIVLALVLVGGGSLMFWAKAGHVRQAARLHAEAVEAFDAASRDVNARTDVSTGTESIDTSPPIPIEVDDAAPAPVDTPSSSGADEPGVAEMEEFVAESDWIVSEPGTGGPSLYHPVGVTLSDRPPWVGAPAYAENHVDYVPITSGPWVTRGECRRALHEAMADAVNEYVADHHGEEAAVQYVGIDLEYIENQLQAEPVYEEMVKYESIDHPMRQQHTLLKFGKDFRDEIERRWNQVVVTTRLAHVGLVLVAVLFGLGTIFSYFRLDTATKGYYSGRLQLATGTVILGLVAFGILVARWVPWL